MKPIFLLRIVPIQFLLRTIDYLLIIMLPFKTCERLLRFYFSFLLSHFKTIKIYIIYRFISNQSGKTHIFQFKKILTSLVQKKKTC